ncbi:hypothetical protein ACWC0C_47655, partial [Streptomyces sp. NPDC001709]
MRQHRPIDHDRHSGIMPSTWHDTSPAITHQLVKNLGSLTLKLLKVASQQQTVTSLPRPEAPRLAVSGQCSN